jgi:hypothetical protein
MMKIFSSFRILVAAPTADRGEGPAAWRHDPLAHPVIRTMSEREIADLPLRARLPLPAGRPGC